MHANFVSDPTVDFNDFLVLSQHFGESWGGATNYVATADELAAMEAFFSGGGASGVPEPASLGLLVVGGSALLLRRRRGLRG